MVGVKIALEDDVVIPVYATAGSSGLDLKANLKAPLVIEPGSIVCVPTGIRLQIPVDYEVQIRPRSGLALNYGITVLNTPGTIDSDYHHEIKVILINHGQEKYVVNPRDRIAQMVLGKVEKMEFEKVDQILRTLS